jgi:hypothetical protein
MDELEFDSYRLRMKFCKWYLKLFKQDKELDKVLGPFTYQEATAEAKKLLQRGIRDADRG